MEKPLALEDKKAEDVKVNISTKKEELEVSPSTREDEDKDKQ